jgi:hypothetical protein
MDFKFGTDDQKNSNKEGKRILLCIDNGTNKATSSAFCLLCKNFRPNSNDKLYLINIYSSWDYLNEEKNAGKLMLDQYARLCKIDGMKVEFARQFESDDPPSELLELIEEYKIDEVFIGEQAFTAPIGVNNLVFSTFSYLKQKIWGSMADYLLYYCKCRCVVVPDPSVIHELDLISGFEESPVSAKMRKSVPVSRPVNGDDEYEI